MTTMTTDEYIAHRKDQFKHLKEPFEPFMALPEAKKLLGVSYAVITGAIRDGRLPAYDITGRTVDRASITGHTRGLRISPADLRVYIQGLRVG